MATELFPPARTEFCPRSPENYLLVENQEDGRVVIHAAFDNYTEQRKALFIRELAAEGFIPDEYEYLTSTGGFGFMGVYWVIDDSWLEIPQEVVTTSHRRGWELFLSMFIVAVVIFDWLIIRGTC
jgi:hypothetical protein